ncbi:hypothetical protein Tco_0392566 [Tanacetum coccineum]
MALRLRREGCFQWLGPLVSVVPGPVPTLLQSSDINNPDSILPSILMLFFLGKFDALKRHGTNGYIATRNTKFSSFEPADETNSPFRTFEIERLAAHKLFVATFLLLKSFFKTSGVEKSEEDDRKRLVSKVVKSPREERNLRDHSGDGGNTGDRGKIVGGAIGARGDGIGNSLLVASYACMNFIYGSSRKGEMASKAKRYLDKSSEGLGEVFPGTSSHQHDDDDDDDVETSRASTPSPTTYLNSLDPLNYQNYQMPSSSERTNETLFERQTDLLNQMQQMHKEMRGGFKSFGKALKGVFSKKKK